ncbi:MAG: Octaprenyl diphosphate synthase [Legionellaceae bacterium]
MNLELIRQLVEQELLATDQVIHDQLNSKISIINELSEYIIKSGGKRLRPILVLLGAKLFGYSGVAHINLAAVIELIHTATLLHDDVVDASLLRRGKDTANAIWDNSASVLVGDYLYSRSFQMMIETNSMPVMAILAEATNTIAEGEVLQLQNRNNPYTTRQQYMEVLRCKTGTLFKTAAQLGPVLCGQFPDIISAMGDYGLSLGMAFQLIDDALDYCSSEKEMGKNLGDDLAEGKPTLPLIYILETGTKAQKQLVQNAIVENNRDHLPEILEAITATNAIDYTYQIAELQIQQGLEKLHNMPMSPYLDGLINLAEFAIKRRY